MKPISRANTGNETMPLTEKPAGNEPTNEPRSLASRIFRLVPPYLVACPAFASYILSRGWSLSESARTGGGDPGTVNLIALAIALPFLIMQFLVLIPLHVWLGVREKRPVALSTLAWIVVSPLPFVPSLYVAFASPP